MEEEKGKVKSISSSFEEYVRTVLLSDATECKACMYCGNLSMLAKISAKGVFEYQVQCSCGASGSWTSSLEKAVDGWNCLKDTCYF